MRSTTALGSTGQMKRGMGLRPAGTGVLRHLGLVLAGLACAAGFLIASGSAASASHHKTATHKAKPKTVPSSASLCSYLNDSAGSAKFGAAILAGEKSGNVAATKQLFLTLANAIEKSAAPGDAALRSAPANVQAAIKTIGGAIPQLKTAIGNATTETQVLSAFGVLGATPGVASAEVTLSQYTIAHCGG
jgi:hypothetical protein